MKKVIRIGKKVAYDELDWEDDPEIAPFLDSKYTVNITFEEITWVDNEDPNGYEEDRGFEEEGEIYDFDDLVSKIATEGYSEFSSGTIRSVSDMYPGIWVSNYSYISDYSTGTERSESLHIGEVDGKEPTPESLWAVFKAAGLVK